VVTKVIFFYDSYVKNIPMLIINIMFLLLIELSTYLAIYLQDKKTKKGRILSAAFIIIQRTRTDPKIRSSY